MVINKYYYSVLPSSGSIGKAKVAKSDIVRITMKSGSTYEGQVNELNERHGFGVYSVVCGGR